MLGELYNKMFKSMCLPDINVTINGKTRNQTPDITTYNGTFMRA